MKWPPVFRRSALFSDCRRYRYELVRRWDAARPNVNFIMLNPSTADETEDDPTIRRCQGFARLWGLGGVVITNLFAWRATDPKQLAAAVDPVGPDNDRHLLAAADLAHLVVCAWGTHGELNGRSRVVLEEVLRGRTLHCLSLTKRGHPGHPLYLRGNLTPLLLKTPSGKERPLP